MNESEIREIHDNDRASLFRRILLGCHISRRIFGLRNLLNLLSVFFEGTMKLGICNAFSTTSFRECRASNTAFNIFTVVLSKPPHDSLFCGKAGGDISKNQRHGGLHFRLKQYIADFAAKEPGWQAGASPIRDEEGKP